VGVSIVAVREHMNGDVAMMVAGSNLHAPTAERLIQLL